MKKTLIFDFFYGKIETEIESGLFQQTIKTLNKLFRTFLSKEILLPKSYANFNFWQYFLFWP